jgi:site-specific recombinase XerD
LKRDTASLSPLACSHSAAADAVRILKRRIAEMQNGQPVGPDVERTTIEQLFSMVEDDYAKNKRRSVDRLSRSLKHLRGFFGEYTRVVDVDEANITTYVRERQEEGAENATINRELAALKRAYRLLFNASMPRAQALGELEPDALAVPEVRRLIEFVTAARRGVPA